MNIEMERNMWGSGKKINRMVLDKKPLLTKNHIKETIRMVKKVEMEYSNLKMDHSILVNLKMMKYQDMENVNGQLVTDMLVHG